MGKQKGGTVNISDAFESYGKTHFNLRLYLIDMFCVGAFAVGKINDEERFDVVRHACPGAGACGGMYTANTMSSALEVILQDLQYNAMISLTSGSWNVIAVFIKYTCTVPS